MALFNWSEKFLLGIKEIDKEHKLLVDLINELSEAKQTKKSDGVVGKVLDGLVFYTEAHLTNEEYLLQKYNYPEFNSHKSIHDGLVKQVLSLKKKYYEENTDFATNVAILLNDWLAEHILVEDKKYAEYLKAQKCEVTLRIEEIARVTVGIQEIDKQHYKVLDLFNSIVTAKEKKNEQELMSCIPKLTEHWEIHFKYEEDLMEQYKYAGIAGHKKEHEDVTNHFLNLEEMCSRGFTYVTSCLALYLNQWIDEHISHIYGEDKKLAKFLKSKNVS